VNEHLDAEQIENIRSECLEKLQDAVERYMPAIGEQVNCIAVHGSDSAHHAIRKHLAKQHYDLLIMATVGKTGLSHLLGMGSTTATLVRAVKTTIMAVKPDTQA
jgi:nucleotide-binding universal stress UspA family protein